MWRVYRSPTDVLRGSGPDDWPAGIDGVQVVVLMEPPERAGWTYKRDGQTCVVRDRQLWTGEDEYDPFGWGTIYGSWLSDAAYLETWNRACSD